MNGFYLLSWQFSNLAPITDSGHPLSTPQAPEGGLAGGTQPRSSDRGGNWRRAVESCFNYRTKLLVNGQTAGPHLPPGHVGLKPDAHYSTQAGILMPAPHSDRSFPYLTNLCFSPDRAVSPCTPLIPGLHPGLISRPPAGDFRHSLGRCSSSAGCFFCSLCLGAFVVICGFLLPTARCFIVRVFSSRSSRLPVRSFPTATSLVQISPALSPRNPDSSGWRSADWSAHSATFVRSAASRIPDRTYWRFRS